MAVDLFCGAGGLSAGLETAGFDVVCASDYDPVHAATHAFNFPNTATLCRNVASLRGVDLLTAAHEGAEDHGNAWSGPIDLIAGGPPCQGFSFIGKRLIDDERNQLVFHFFRLVKELRPRYFVMENVPGMASGGHAGVLEQLVEEFEDIGYRFPTTRWGILNAADFGVPQDRRRLFLIGAAEGEAIATLPEPSVQPVHRDGSPSAQIGDLPLGPTVWDAIRDIPNLNRYPRLLESDEVKLSSATFSEQEELVTDYVRQLRGVGPAVEQDLGTARLWSPDQLTASARTVHNADSIRRFRRTKPGTVEPISRFYRLPSAGLCNTLRAGTGSERGAFTSPRPIHPYLPRVLSNREAARLHSLPDWFRVHSTKWHGFRQIGNAVAPLVGKAVGESVVSALGATPVKRPGILALGDRSLLDLTMREAIAFFGVDTAEVPAQRRRQAEALPAIAA